MGRPEISPSPRSYQAKSHRWWLMLECRYYTRQLVAALGALVADILRPQVSR